MEPTFSKGGVYQSPTQSLAVGQYMSKVYMWMTIGILLTGMVAMGFASDPNLVFTVASNKILYWGLFIAQIGLVLWLSAGINKMNSMMATCLFLVYASLTGVTLSVISLVYTQESIASAFFTTAAGFAGLSAYGFFTKRDLGPVGNFCQMGLWGLVGFSILSMFFPSMMGTTASKVYGLIGIVVFAGLTAYDTQAIKAMAVHSRSAEEHHKGAILGALKLYLDFINLFLFILRMSGDRRK
ncbi:MAG: Bax inhibitor-1/YccA family protein [Bdellovibrionales bacterium]|nr:Bax inhibitor-1/YccA family protein [Bdellovibrionales bacterium]